MQEILHYLKEHGERLDTEIAAETGISLKKVRLYLPELSSKGEVIICRTTRFPNGKPVEGLLCRLAGYIPPASPGRKSKASQQARHGHDSHNEDPNPPLRQTKSSTAKKKLSIA